MQIKNKQSTIGFLSSTKEILPFFKNFKNYNYVKNAEFIAKLNKKIENIDSNFIDFILNDVKKLPLQKAEIALAKASKNEIYQKEYKFKGGFQLQRYITIFDDEEIALSYYIYFNNVSYLDSIDIGLDGEGNLTSLVSETINKILNELPKLTIIKKKKNKKHFKWIMEKVKSKKELQ